VLDADKLLVGVVTRRDPLMGEMRDARQCGTSVTSFAARRPSLWRRRRLRAYPNERRMLLQRLRMGVCA
jgi:hypothetical protein